MIIIFFPPTPSHDQTTRLKGRTDQSQTKIDPTRSDQEDAEVLTAKIMACAYRGDLKELKYYAMRFGRLVDVEDYDKRGPLHGAASAGHLLCVKYLIQMVCLFVCCFSIPLVPSCIAVVMICRLDDLYYYFVIHFCLVCVCVLCRAAAAIQETVGGTQPWKMHGGKAIHGS